MLGRKSGPPTQWRARTNSARLTPGRDRLRLDDSQPWTWAAGPSPSPSTINDISVRREHRGGIDVFASRLEPSVITASFTKWVRDVQIVHRFWQHRPSTIVDTIGW